MAREPEAHRFYPAGSRFVVFFTIITGYWTHCFFTGELNLSVCSKSQKWMVILLYFRFVKSQQSPSMRGRGLKRPHRPISARPPMSPSMRGRGLKHRKRRSIQPRRPVALHARAWIETDLRSRARPGAHVALHARAWIETYTET